MKEMSNSEQLTYTTVRITSIKDGEITGYGTGFFFDFLNDGKTQVPSIVTNKHVIENAEAIEICFHLADSGKPSGRFIKIQIPIDNRTVTHHPDPNIDLTSIHIAEILINAINAGRPIFSVSLSMPLIPDEADWKHFGAMEEVVMIGCPNGLSDEANNLPIARRGIAATAPSKNYNGKPEFMVDMACFPGSSGSPVFIYNQNGYFDQKTGNHVMGARAIFIGILYSGPLINNTGSIILGHNATFQVSAMMHLGNVIKSLELKKLEEAIAIKAG